jgi:diguanylate cyclase (GGDEF)-like protein
MDGQIIPKLLHHAPAPLPIEVLAEVSAGILIVASDGVCIYANVAAEAFFAPLQPPGLKLRALLSLTGFSNGAALVEATESGQPSNAVRIGAIDGRILEGHSRGLKDGSSVITLVDVTNYIRDAELAAHDPLTGLANRTALGKCLKIQLANSSRSAMPVAVVCIDLDRFKNVNDTLGHAVGDALLVKVAERLRNAVRQSDMVARLGGDEFAIIQSGVAQPQGAEIMARRLVDLVGRSYALNGHMVNIGVSIGIAISPGDGADNDTLLQHADLALYRAKSDGRGTFRFFRSDMDADMQKRRWLEFNLRRALALKQFEVVYQPQMHLESDTLIGFEALLRWRTPERGNISPAEFIPLAEELGLIIPIGEWVMRTACKEAVGWSRPVTVAVNISAVQFCGNKLVAMVSSALAASGLDPARLELEITEGALLDNTSTVLQELNALKALGIRISMDDFGTGYSSLSYLQKFPFDKIKIDQSFVRGDQSRGGSAIVRAVTAIGASLGMKTIAEGVETQEQLERVRADGCNAVQGYLTGRPLAAAAAAALLDESPISSTSRLDDPS